MRRVAIVAAAALALGACGGEDNKTEEPRSISQGIDASCEQWDNERTVSRCRTEAREVYVQCRADQSSGGQLDPDPYAVAACEGEARAWTPDSPDPFRP